MALSHNAILVSRMHLATMALLCKQTTDNSRTGFPPEPRWRHLSGNRILFVPHWMKLAPIVFCLMVAIPLPDIRADGQAEFLSNNEKLPLTESDMSDYR